MSYTGADGKQVQYDVPVTDGTWEKALRNLPVEKTTVHLTALNGNNAIAETDIEVDLGLRDLTVAGNFAGDVETAATVSGTATPNTLINVSYMQKELASAVSDKDGNYTIPVNAPNRAGEYELTVAQEIRGMEHSVKTITLDYGTGVSITSPANDFELDPGERLVVSGTAQKNTKLAVYEKGHADTPLWTGTSSSSNDTYRAVIDADKLEDRKYDLVVAGISKGYNTTTAEVTINPGKSSVADPTAAVRFDADVTHKATVEGTAVAGSTITVKNGADVLGTVNQVAANGAWTLPIDPIGAGKHTLTIEQTGADENTQTTTADADFGAAVSINAPTSFTGGAMTVTGQSSKGAIVTIVSGGKQIDTFTVSNEDGSFSRDLKGLGSGKIALQVNAKSKGGLVTTTTASSTAPITAESVQLASHVKNGTFTPGLQHFVGRGTVGATVTLNPFGFDPKYSGYNLTATVDQFGEWAIDRNLSDTPYGLFAFKQTPQAGVTNEVLNYGLKPYKEIGEPGDLQVTNFKAGDFFNPGDQVFAGKATPGATIVFNPFGFDPKYSKYNITTTADEKTGTWQVRRGLANTIYREVAVKQEPEAAGKVNKIEHIALAANGWVGAPADLTVTSHDNNGSFTPGTQQTFTGTATPGTQVTLYPFGTKYPTYAITATADAVGKWEIKRTLGNQVFPMVFTQDTENAGSKTDHVDIRLVPTP